ncbi:phosphatase PAP2 family protein [Flagellimonas eckloniae]|uniref:Phosphatidic acid phosphatase n=1 Tax=Flagellimonas eckloniae TaxID=346185 RepID=A0A0Q1H7Q0_9FLAO|nr:phosphatase PAP2 family protein [Allomuricauda eckloniae]KQC29726.1 phosphatidic acid phosphatase [Allomuricauda eckloniae]
MFQKLLNWDKETFIYLNGLGTESYDSFWSTITEITTWIPLFLLFALLFILKFPRRESLLNILSVVATTIFIVVLTYLAKIFIERPRPCNDETINSAIRILKTPTDYSFFSGHASSSFAITAMVFLLLRSRVKWAWIFFLWPLAFSYSRIYVGVHFPLDILVGAIIGILSAIFFYKMYKRLFYPTQG